MNRSLIYNLNAYNISIEMVSKRVYSCITNENLATATNKIHLFTSSATHHMCFCISCLFMDGINRLLNFEIILLLL